ncbi:hypothetical protein AMTR_s00072p00110190 [Amborella trichopoda]|uniref:Uncharacterized protein n=1 Tax=Amborella trichopoda TaxID=13333 RepID=W1NPA6_AMBTC|nr:hypothetical protein AMTR_s00072p00110190 [Amborella trichopoda]
MENLSYACPCPRTDPYGTRSRIYWAKFLPGAIGTLIVTLSHVILKTIGGIEIGHRKTDDHSRSVLRGWASQFGLHMFVMRGFRSRRSLQLMRRCKHLTMRGVRDKVTDIIEGAIPLAMVLANGEPSLNYPGKTETAASWEATLVGKEVEKGVIPVEEAIEVRVVPMEETVVKEDSPTEDVVEERDAPIEEVVEEVNVFDPSYNPPRDSKLTAEEMDTLHDFLIYHFEVLLFPNGSEGDP